MTVSDRTMQGLCSVSYYFTDGQWRYYASGPKSRGNPRSAESKPIAA